MDAMVWPAPGLWTYVQSQPENNIKKANGLHVLPHGQHMATLDLEANKASRRATNCRRV